jgi:hypothetical protein
VTLGQRADPLVEQRCKRQHVRRRVAPAARTAGDQAQCLGEVGVHGVRDGPDQLELVERHALHLNDRWRLLHAHGHDAAAPRRQRHRLL